MSNEINTVYDRVDIEPRYVNGRVVQWLASVTVGAYAKHRLFWVRANHSETAIQRVAMSWAQRVREELRENVETAEARAKHEALVREQLKQEDEAERFRLHLLRVEAKTRCVHTAIERYGKGRTYYPGGYTNVYGERVEWLT